MASSNIKLFDENKGNMLTDTEFNISTQRLNGLQTGVASSQLQNKAMYQASLVAYAIAQIMLQNGLNANDTDAVSAFVANLSGTFLQKVHDIATTEEAQAGLATGKWMSPALVKAAIDTLAAKAQNILSDETKALFGLGSSAVPDDVFQILSKIGAEVHVFADVGTTVTMSRGGRTLTAKVGSDGNAVLYTAELGEWTIVCIFDGSQKTINYTLEAIGIVHVFPFTVGATLNDTPWESINTVSKLGMAEQLWSVGDTKTTSVNGTDYEFQIIGFNHDDKTAGGKAGITFQMVDCLNTTYAMNGSASNNGGWKNSALRSRMSTFLSQLPSDLQSAIKAVDKLVSAGNNTSTIETVSDKLFLLSEVEIFGSTASSFAGEGSQYDWYKAGNTKIKKVNGSATEWWERSPLKGSTEYFCNVINDGKPGGHWANFSCGVSFAFCV